MPARRPCSTHSSRQGSRSPEGVDCPVCLTPTGRVTCARLDGCRMARQATRISERWPSGRRRWTGIPVTSSRVYVGSNPTLSAKCQKARVNSPGLFAFGAEGGVRAHEKWVRQNRMERFWTSLIESSAAISDGPAGAPAMDGKAQSHGIESLGVADVHRLRLAPPSRYNPHHGYP